MQICQSPNSFYPLVLASQFWGRYDTPNKKVTFQLSISIDNTMTLALKSIPSNPNHNIAIYESGPKVYQVIYTKTGVC